MIILMYLPCGWQQLSTSLVQTNIDWYILMTINGWPFEFPYTFIHTFVVPWLLVLHHYDADICGFEENVLTNEWFTMKSGTRIPFDMTITSIFFSPHTYIRSHFEFVPNFWYMAKYLHNQWHSWQPLIYFVLSKRHRANTVNASPFMNVAIAIVNMLACWHWASAQSGAVPCRLTELLICAVNSQSCFQTHTSRHFPFSSVGVSINIRILESYLKWAVTGGIITALCFTLPKWKISHHPWKTKCGRAVGYEGLSISSKSGRVNYRQDEDWWS